jgi:AAA domain
MAARLFDEAINLAEPKPRAPADHRGGEERIEQALVHEDCWVATSSPRHVLFDTNAALPLPGRPVSRRADHRGAAAPSGQWPAALATDRGREGDPVGGGRNRTFVGREPPTGAAVGTHVEGPGHYRRPGCRQDDPRQFHSEDDPAKQVEVALCTPTGRAAKRLSDSTGLKAKTIHRLLETDAKTGGFKRSGKHPLECPSGGGRDLYGGRAIDARPPHGAAGRAALLLVGDKDQLPSVGPGQVLADIIGAGAMPVMRLTEVFRQTAESQVIINAHRINQGKMPELKAIERSDFFFVDAADPGEGVRRCSAR